MSVFHPQIIDAQSRIVYSNTTFQTRSEPGDLLVAIVNSTHATGAGSIVGATQIDFSTNNSLRLRILQKTVSQTNEEFTTSGIFAANRFTLFVFRGKSGTPLLLDHALFTGKKPFASATGNPGSNLRTQSPASIFSFAFVERWRAGDTISLPPEFTGFQTNFETFYPVSQEPSLSIGYKNENTGTPLTTYSHPYSVTAFEEVDWISGCFAIRADEPRINTVTLAQSGQTINTGALQQNDVVVVSLVRTGAGGGSGWTIPPGWTTAVSFNNGKQVLAWIRISSTLPSFSFSPNESGGQNPMGYYTVWKNVNRINSVKVSWGDNETVYRQNEEGIAGGVQYVAAVGHGTENSGTNKLPDGAIELIQTELNPDFYAGYFNLTRTEDLPSRDFGGIIDFITSHTLVLSPTDEYVEQFESGGLLSATIRETGPFHEQANGGSELSGENKGRINRQPTNDGGASVNANVTNQQGHLSATTGGVLVDGLTDEDGGARVVASGGVEAITKFVTVQDHSQVVIGGIDVGSVAIVRKSSSETLTGAVELGSVAVPRKIARASFVGGSVFDGTTTENFTSTYRFIGGVEQASGVTNKLAGRNNPAGGIEVGSSLRSVSSVSDGFDGGMVFATLSDVDTNAMFVWSCGLHFSGATIAGQSVTKIATGGSDLGSVSTIGRSITDSTLGGVEFGTASNTFTIAHPPLVGSLILEPVFGLQVTALRQFAGGVEVDGYHISKHVQGVIADGGVWIDSSSIIGEVEAAIGGVLIGDDEDLEPRISRQCRLKLKAGSVDTDVGFLYVPVYLRMGEVDTSRYEFLTLSGDTIPHFVRSQRDNEVRAMVYLKPDPLTDYEFIVRVG